MLSVVFGARRTGGFITLHSALLVLACLALYLVGPLGQVYLAGSLLLSILFLASSLWLWWRPNKQQAWRNYKLSGIYLLGIFLFIAVDVLV